MVIEWLRVLQPSICLGQQGHFRVKAKVMVDTARAANGGNGGTRTSQNRPSRAALQPSLQQPWWTFVESSQTLVLLEDPS